MRRNPKFDEVADDYAEHVAADKERKTATVKFASGRPQALGLRVEKLLMEVVPESKEVTGLQ